MNMQDYTLAKLLIRVTRIFNDKKSRLELLVSKERYGRVPRAYFIVSEDKAIPIELQCYMVDATPPKEVREIRGADHFVMISKPLELCRNLLEAAMK
jgi:hypothetical protein